MKIVLVSGGFDPLHRGHIEYLKQARLLGNKLIVILNSDAWLIRKKGKVFLPFEERMEIIKHLEFVDEVWSVNDNDNTVCAALESAKSVYSYADIIFANGGDRTQHNTPELQVEGIQFAYGIGGITKQNSSSELLKKWSTIYSEKRIWGTFYELFKDKHIKVKELIVEPWQFTSYQRHLRRNELWFIHKGACSVRYGKNTYKPKKYKEIFLNKHDYFIVKVGEWHQIINEFDKPCHIIEIQYGKKTIEEDIEKDFSEPFSKIVYEPNENSKT